MNPLVLVGEFIGGMSAFLFCGMTMNAVGRAAQKMVDKVRRQFREITGIMANAGGAWNNAKKNLEEGNLDGKRSACHNAAVIGDTVVDPFKDTSGPSLNILIKLMTMVSIVMVEVTLSMNL